MRIIFVTGTDTGVGKTLLTALLLSHLRQSGHPAFAIKPFCSGSRADARLLLALQRGALSLDEINPFFYPEPVAPLVSARLHRRPVRLGRVLSHIRSLATRLLDSAIKNRKSKIKNPVLLIEGSGGLLVPLGQGYGVLDLIAALRCEVFVVARNKLGTINHTLLTASALQSAGLQKLGLVLMDCRRPDFSARSNARVLRELLAPVTLLTIPFLGSACRRVRGIRASASALRPILARLTSG